MDFRGYAGPMNVEKKNWATPLQKAFMEAGQEIGYADVDPNGFGQIGKMTIISHHQLVLVGRAQ